MKSWTQIALALGLAVSVTACAGDTATDETTPARDTGAAVGTAGAGMGERNFIEEHIKMNEAELAIGRLAQERATNPQVREFAQAMVRDHQTALTELRRVASDNNVEVDMEDAAEEQRDVRERLMEQKGAEFDREFMNWAVDKHEEAVDDVEDQVDSENQALRGWATKTLPTLRKHLDMARSIQASLNETNERR
jgi:putative membrane protein